MSQLLFFAAFSWYNPDQGTSDWTFNVPDDSPVGYILEVDLQYLPTLHDRQNSYPLAPGIVDIIAEMLSPFAGNLAKTFTKSRKLTPNLKDKHEHITHYRNLKIILIFRPRTQKTASSSSI